MGKRYQVLCLCSDSGIVKFRDWFVGNVVKSIWQVFTEILTTSRHIKYRSGLRIGQLIHNRPKLLLEGVGHLLHSGIDEPSIVQLQHLPNSLS